MASYQGRRLLLERSGMNALLATPIPVPNGDSREQLEGTGHIGNIHQPFQRRMEVCSCKLSMPAIGCRELEPGDPIRVIVQEEMHQFVREVVENGMHDKQGWLRQAAGSGLCPGQVLHGDPEIAPISLAESSPSLDETQRRGGGLCARPYATAQSCSHASFRLFLLLARPVACSWQNIVGIGTG